MDLGLSNTLRTLDTHDTDPLALRVSPVSVSSSSLSALLPTGFDTQATKNDITDTETTPIPMAPDAVNVQDLIDCESRIWWDPSTLTGLSGNSSHSGENVT